MVKPLPGYIGPDNYVGLLKIAPSEKEEIYPIDFVEYLSKSCYDWIFEKPLLTSANAAVE